MGYAVESQLRRRWWWLWWVKNFHTVEIFTAGRQEQYTIGNSHLSSSYACYDSLRNQVITALMAIWFLIAIDSNLLLESTQFAVAMRLSSASHTAPQRTVTGHRCTPALTTKRNPISTLRFPFPVSLFEVIRHRLTGAGDAFACSILSQDSRGRGSEVPAPQAAHHKLLWRSDVWSQMRAILDWEWGVRIACSVSAFRMRGADKSRGKEGFPAEQECSPGEYCWNWVLLRSTTSNQAQTSYEAAYLTEN